MRDAADGFELAVERYIDAPPAIVWRAWTERLTEWRCPKPWTTTIIEHDLRPGGRSAMVMTGPNGETSSGDGVFLEVVPEKSVVFTDALRAGWVPQSPFMVGYFHFTAEGSGTRYRAGARHWDEAAAKQHEEMGFTEGWTIVANQLAAIAEEMAREAKP